MAGPAVPTLPRLVVSGILVRSLVLRPTGAQSGQPRSLELRDTPDGRLCAQPSMRVSRNTGMSRSVFTW